VPTAGSLKLVPLMFTARTMATSANCSRRPLAGARYLVLQRAGERVRHGRRRARHPAAETITVPYVFQAQD